jgi:hypothetical protein
MFMLSSTPGAQLPRTHKIRGVQGAREGELHFPELAGVQIQLECRGPGEKYSFPPDGYSHLIQTQI